MNKRVFWIAILTVALASPVLSPTVFAQQVPQPSDFFSVPGITQGIGAHFAITDSNYLNITVDSSDIVDLKLESIPSVVRMALIPVSVVASTQITVSGFTPNTAYYKYEDNYHNLTEFVTDSNGNYTYVQDLSIPHLVFIQTRHSTKFIADNSTGGDCLSIGTWDSLTKICTLTTDVYETVEIDSNNVTLDGNHHIISPGSSGTGVFSQGRTGVTVKNLTINQAAFGITLYNDYNSTVTGNTVTGAAYGIDIAGGNSNTVTWNVANSNSYYGIYLDSTSSNSIDHNTTNNNGRNGIQLYYLSYVGLSPNNQILDNTLQENGQMDLGVMVSESSSVACVNTITGNTGSGGRPILYFDSPTTLAGGTYSELVLCNAGNSDISNITIDGSATKNNNTLLVWWTTGSKFTNVTSSNNLHGVFLYHSDSNTLKNITASNNAGLGIFLVASNGNGIDGGTLDSNGGGLYISSPSGGPGSSVVHNVTMSNNVSYGLAIYGINNSVYNNNFINNISRQVSASSGNIFNLAAPIGGNYWSDYNTPTQGCNDLNNDGFCDSPYQTWPGNLYNNNYDYLPWAKQDGWVVKTLPEKAADLAKELVNSAYLYGGKGWDYNQNEFVAPTVIKSGYTFWSGVLHAAEFNTGVDCSGLIMWAYDRSFDPSKSRFNNFVTVEGADQQFVWNAEPIIGSQPQLGDVMFFDWGKYNKTTGEWDGIRDGYIDHVAMYVGASGGYDVVNARSKELGIRGMSSDALDALPGFVAFKRVIQGPPPAEMATALSPIDLIVTDPDGYTITSTTTLPSNEEYLREIPGVLYYSEMERGLDGNPMDQVYSFVRKTGDYIIKVLPDQSASSTSTYGLEFSAGGQSVTLVQSTPISQIPLQGYGVSVLASGTVRTFIPVAIDIKPGSDPNSINLKSNGVTPVAILGNSMFDVHQINPSTITLAGSPAKLRGGGQPMVDYEDVNGDGYVDLVTHVITSKLQLTTSSVKAELDGFLIDGREIRGSDSVKIVPK